MAMTELPDEFREFLSGLFADEKNQRDAIAHSRRDESRELIGQTTVRPSVSYCHLTVLGPTPDMVEAHTMATALEKNWHTYFAEYQALLDELTSQSHLIPALPLKRRISGDERSILFSLPSFNVLTPSGFPATLQNYYRISSAGYDSQSWCEVSYPSFASDGRSLIPGVDPRNLSVIIREFKNIAQRFSQLESLRLKTIAHIGSFTIFDDPQQLEVVALAISQDAALTTSVEKMVSYDQSTGLDNDYMGMMPIGSIRDYVDTINSYKCLGDAGDMDDRDDRWQTPKIDIVDQKGATRQGDIVLHTMRSEELIRAIAIGSEDGTNGTLAHLAGFQIGARLGRKKTGVL